MRSGTSQPGSAAEQADADRSAEQDTHDAPGPRGGDSYDPRPLEDSTRRGIAYKLIALLAFLVIALLAMVVFGVITVGEVKEFDLFLAPLVALVTGGHRLLLHQKTYLIAARSRTLQRREDRR